MRIGEAPDRDADRVGQPLALPEHGRSAGGTELKGQPDAALALAAEGAAFTPAQDDLALAEESRRAEHRAGAPLAGLAMAGRDAVRIAGQPDPELTAGAGRLALGGLSHAGRLSKHFAAYQPET